MKILKIHRPPTTNSKSSDKRQAYVPVISVGNITAGGTGKTPLVVWLCRNLQKKGLRCGILTRGYKTRKGELSDEPAILTKNCPKAKVIVNSDRVAGATKAVESYGVEAIVLDDGFQHRRLYRNLNIVTIDATNPFGFGRVLPAGLLREPLPAMRRAQAAVLTRCDQVVESKIVDIEKKLSRINPEIVIARSVHRPVCAKAIGNCQISMEELKEKNIFAFCGIGNPDAFISTIKDMQLKLVGTEIFNDHHNYTEEDINNIYIQASLVNADLILTTEKDWNKTALPASGRDDMQLAYLAIELEFITGEKQITELIEDALACKMSADKDLDN